MQTLLGMPLSWLYIYLLLHLGRSLLLRPAVKQIPVAPVHYAV